MSPRVVKRADGLKVSRTTPTARWRVLIVEDHPITRQGVRVMLESMEGVEVVAEAASGLEAIERAQESDANLVLMDVNLPGMDGFETTRRLKEALTDATVVVLTVREDAEAVAAAFRAGASGFVSKSAGLIDLGEMLHSIETDGVYLRPADTGRLLQAMGTEHAPRTSVALTGRERQVLDLLADGKTARAIGGRLGIGERTVNTYVGAIYRKLGVTNKVSAVREALRLGIMAPPV